jgi:hypothetical protein
MAAMVANEIVKKSYLQPPLRPLSLIAAVHSKMISDLTVQTPDSQHHD